MKNPCLTSLSAATPHRLRQTAKLLCFQWFVQLTVLRSHQVGRGSFNRFGVALLVLLLAFSGASAQTKRLLHRESTPNEAAARGNEFKVYADRFEWMMHIDVRKQFQRDSIPLYVAEFGAGPDTLVFLHGGFGAEHSALLDAFLYLAKNHHLVFYDQRGSLRSYCPDSLISLNDHVQDLERLRKALRTPRLNLIGHSMGTLLAMHYLQAYPARVNRLVMVGAIPAKVDKQASFWKATENTVPDTARYRAIGRTFTAQLAQAGISRADYRRYQQRQLPPDAHYYFVRQFPFAVVNLYKYERWRDAKGCYLYKANAGSAALKTVPDCWNFTNLLAQHPAKITVIHGQQDFIPIRLHSEIMPLMPNVNLVALPESNHIPWVDSPRAFRAAMQEALR